MNLASITLVLALIAILSPMGCARHQHFPQSSLTGRILEVTIDDIVNPALVTAKRGDEIKWVNRTKSPMDVSVVQTREELISCQKGFASANLGYMFGTSEYENIVMATVPPNEFASLCFAISGKYVYTVRMNAAGPSNKITGAIVVE